ncbi:MAG: site-2 protease family protein, partial [Patescibacteria group bacterium]
MHVLIFFIILLVLVLVHELGHFIAAKKNGVLVEEFGIGFPPKLFGFKKGETLYTFNLIPLGGFVKVYGEEYHEEESNIHPELKSRAFINKKPWQKTVIIVSGIIGNFIFGWILISFLFTQGVPVPANHVIVEQVQSGSPAEVAHLKPKDIISKVEVDKKIISITTSNDLIDLSKKNSGKQIKLFITRNNKQVETILT